MTATVELRMYAPDQVVHFCKTREAFGGLSNMAAGFQLTVNAIEIRTPEALYQACRFPHLPDVQRVIIAQRSPMTAKMKSKMYRNQTRPDWDAVRVDIMRWCLRVKLAQHWDSFGELLRSTGDGPIVEVSRKDPFWGARPAEDGRLMGLNVLGRLLRQLRDELRGPDAVALHVVQPLSIPDFLLDSRPIGLLGSHDSTPLPRQRGVSENTVLKWPVDQAPEADGTPAPAPRKRKSENSGTDSSGAPATSKPLLAARKRKSKKDQEPSLLLLPLEPAAADAPNGAITDNHQ